MSHVGSDAVAAVVKLGDAPQIELAILPAVTRYAPQQLPSQPELVVASVVFQRLEGRILIRLAPIGAGSKQLVRLFVTRPEAQPLGAVCRA